MLAPRLEPSGVELLRAFLQCNPSKRISSAAAIRHEYFNSLPETIYKLDDCESIFSIPSVKLNSEQIPSPTANHSNSTGDNDYLCV